MQKIGFRLLVVVLLFVGFSVCTKAQSSEGNQAKLIEK
jgi:hypothetical protein